MAVQWQAQGTRSRFQDETQVRGLIWNMPHPSQKKTLSILLQVLIPLAHANEDDMDI